MIRQFLYSFIQEISFEKSLSEEITTSVFVEKALLFLGFKKIHEMVSFKFSQFLHLFFPSFLIPEVVSIGYVSVRRRYY